METSEIIAHRLLNQQIAETKLKKPEDLVSHMVAMQAQDFVMAKWAIGLRLPGQTDASVEKAFNDGKILRTHILRPTWHFVSPADIRWLMALSGPRVQHFNKSYYKSFGVADLIRKSMKVIVKQLEGRNYLTRTELNEHLKKSKINSDGIGLSLIMMHAELEGIIISGPKQGKQFTYALLDEIVPSAKIAPKEELLAELAYRYFTTRGPASAQDFNWWSGLGMKESKEAVALVEKKLESFMLNGQQYLFKPKKLKDIAQLHTTFLLPDYDEYGISYKDRSVIFTGKSTHPSTAAYFHMIVIDGIIGGTWKATEKGKEVKMAISYLKPVSKVKEKAVKEAISKYQQFIGKKIIT